MTLTITTDSQDSWLAATDDMVLTINPNPSIPTITELGNTFSCDQTGFNYQWFFNSDTIPGETSQVYVASQTGFYQVAMIDNNGCWAVSANLGYTGLEDLKNGVGAEIYPNPSNGEFVLDISEYGNEVIYLRMENYLGQPVYNQRLGQTKMQVSTRIDVGHLPPGLYSLEIIVGGKRTVMKIVLQ